MTDKQMQFARGGIEFAIDLFQILSAQTSSTTNVVFSPISIQSCVALALAGAQGQTANEICQTMKFATNSTFEVAKSFQTLLAAYQNSELLKIANKVYVQNGNKLKSDYGKMLQEHYYAVAENVDFSKNVQAAEAINKWVEEKTAGNIRDLLSADCLDSNTRLVLVNAVHFKGEWAKKFDTAQTMEGDFWLTNESKIKIPYMNQKAKFAHGYFENLNCAALEMPYKDSDLSMLILLPNECDGLKELAKKLKDVNLIDLVGEMSTNEVVVKIPKFKIDYEVELDNSLKQMGIQRMFGPNAEFGNMLESAEDLYVSKVVHKASIEVNEEGCEASAATGMIMMMRMMPLNIQFIADRPFFYVIWNRKNILFAGAFTDAH